MTAKTFEPLAYGPGLFFWGCPLSTLFVDCFRLVRVIRRSRPERRWRPSPVIRCAPPPMAAWLSRPDTRLQVPTASLRTTGQSRGEGELDFPRSRCGYRVARSSL